VISWFRGHPERGAPMKSVQYRLVANDPDDADGRMAFLEHLDELRQRLIRACIALGAGMLVAFLFVNRLADFVLAPTLRTLPPGTELIATKPGETFSFYLNVALIGGVVLAAPFVMYQVWRFIAPGLYAKEKKLVIPFLALTTLGTIGAVLFTHYVMFPAMMAFFATFSSGRLRFLPRLEDTFDLYVNMILGMVVVFQIPTLVLFLAKMRLVTARFLWRHLKEAILLIFIAAAVLTPSADPWNQTLFAAPMIALYLISIAIAWMVGTRQKEEASAAPKLRLVIAATMLDQALRRRPDGAPRGRSAANRESAIV
jgi:sec-independent protein translocase protein TatC